MSENLVKNSSRGYGYKYASLSDIAKQGFTIPKMQTKTDESTLKEYVYYLDTDLKEWCRGAEIVIPESKGMNKAQLYGSALTYARRYTTLMALQLACDDDKNVEDIDSNGNFKKSAKATANQIKLIKEKYEQHEALLKHYGISTFEELTVEQASELLKAKKESK